MSSPSDGTRQLVSPASFNNKSHLHFLMSDCDKSIRPSFSLSGDYLIDRELQLSFH